MQTSAFFIYSIASARPVVKQACFLNKGECACFYYRTVNLSKLFREAIDSAGKLAIMVLALRKMEC